MSNNSSTNFWPHHLKLPFFTLEHTLAMADAILGPNPRTNAARLTNFLMPSISTLQLSCALRRLFHASAGSLPKLIPQSRMSNNKLYT